MHTGAGGAHCLQDLRCRVAVAVVAADADHGVPSRGGGMQLELDVAGAVVRDGGDIDVQQGTRRGVAQQRRLGRRPGVAGEQHRTAGPIHTQHQ